MKTWRYWEGHEPEDAFKQSRYAQVSLDVSSSSFDVRGGIGTISKDDFVADIVGQNIVILTEGVDGGDILIKEVCRPRW